MISNLWDDIFDQWLKNLQPGDKVCTCTTDHETVESVDYEGGTLTTIEGHLHDIRCVSPVDHPESEHIYP